MTAAKAVFIASGFGIQVALPRILADVEQFGRYATVATVTAILTNTLVAATVQTVSKRVSEKDADAERRQREGLQLGVGLAVLLGGGFALLAPIMAGHWQRDATLTPLFAVAAIVVASYAMYAALIGAVNGRRQFVRQASFDMGFSLLRATAICGGAAIAGAFGALVGFAAAAVLILVVAFAVIGTGRGGSPREIGRWVTVFVPIATYQACLNGILQLDQPLLRAHLAELALERGRSAEEATALASTAAGFYRAAQTFAFVPYQLILAVTFVVFPIVSHSTSAGDDAGTRRAIGGGLRFALLALLAMAAPIAGASDGVMRVAYRDEYLVGSDVLAVLSLGLVPFSMFVVAATILAGAGRAVDGAKIAAAALLVVAVGNRVAVRSAGIGPEAPVAAAIATTVGAGFASIAAAIAVRQRYGMFLPPLTIVRALVAAAVAWTVARLVPHDAAPGAVLACGAGLTAYVGALAVLGELGTADVALLRRILGPPRSGRRGEDRPPPRT
jgi:stage V sporulation protein B